MLVPEPKQIVLNGPFAPFTPSMTPGYVAHCQLAMRLVSACLEPKVDDMTIYNCSTTGAASATAKAMTTPSKVGNTTSTAI